LSDDRDEARVDGRSARRARNREAVLDAVHELFTEQRSFPTLESVAARSGVSLRSIHRYFPDSEGLMLEALARRISLADPLYELDRVGEGTLAERIARLVDQRLEIYEHAHATIRVAFAVADSMPLIAAQVTRREEQVRDQVRAHLAPDLAALTVEQQEAVLSCAEVLTHFAAIDRLRQGRGLTTDEVRRILVEGLGRLLAR
jgi:TetR/AcrR family transcriptional regulator, regulator of autoinduction and epiphytic fitness